MLIGMASFPFGPKTRHKHHPRLAAHHGWVVKHVLGIPYRLIGRGEHPGRPGDRHVQAHVGVGNHHAAGHLPADGLRDEAEIHKLPFFGWGIAQMPMIAIDRAAGKDALAQVVEQGIDRLGHGFWVTIFPEGTRVAPGSKRYKAGASWLAAQTGTPVVPVAHNAGEFWPRNAFFKRPGEVVVSVGPVIDTTGLTAEEINARAEAWVEGEMRRLFPHHYRTPRSKEASTA
jgi:1-acyl-sn-glycerol-3-phosphate acyltransferase